MITKADEDNLGKQHKRSIDIKKQPLGHRTQAKDPMPTLFSGRAAHQLWCYSRKDQCETECNYRTSSNET